LPDEIDPEAPFWGIQQSEIDITTGRLLTEPRRIWAGTGGRSPEGPTSTGSTVATISWSPRERQSIVIALGHADFFEAHDGSWWLVCLGVRPQGIPPTAHLRRETFLASVQWDDAGWPHVGQQGRLRVVMESPALAPISWELQPERDDFDGPHLGVAWNFLGTPATNVWSFRTVRERCACWGTKHGWTTARPSPSSGAGRSILLARWPHRWISSRQPRRGRGPGIHRAWTGNAHGPG
jgi:beta-xylosidase